jgi:hypothetical protein
VAGNIGGEILRRFVVTFDYARRVVHLVPTSARRAVRGRSLGLWINRTRWDVVVGAVMAGGRRTRLDCRSGRPVRHRRRAHREHHAGRASATPTRVAAGKVAALRIARDGASFEAALQLRDLIPAA